MLFHVLVAWLILVLLSQISYGGGISSLASSSISKINLYECVLCVTIGSGCLTGFPTLQDVMSLNSCSSSCSIVGSTSSTQLRLFPTMSISCVGMLEGLTVAGVFGTRSDRPYPELQIWRPTMMGFREYTLTQNRVYEFPGSSRYSSGCTTVLQYTLDPPISVETGDIIGILLPRDHDNQASFRICFSSDTQTPNYIVGSTSATTFTLPSSSDGTSQPLIYLNITESELNELYSLETVLSSG